MNFNRLIYIRENFYLSQRQMAERLTVSKSTYARWETGEKVIPLKHLVDICNISGLSMDYVLGLSHHKKKIDDKIILDKKRVGENLKSFRKKYGLTQEELADELNTTHSTISAYENGKTLILTSFIYEIAVRHNISVDFLVYGESLNIKKQVF